MYTHAQKTHQWSLKQKKKINDAIHLREASSGAAESSTSSCTSESRVSVTMFRGETEEETRRLDYTYEYSDVPMPVVCRSPLFLHLYTCANDHLRCLSLARTNAW